MGQKTRTELKTKQRLKRKKRRQKLSKAGKNPDEYFHAGFYVGKPIK